MGKKSCRDIFSGSPKPRHVLGQSLINALALAVWFALMGKGIRQHSILHCSTSYICDDVVANQSTPAQGIAYNKCLRMSHV